MPAAADFNGGKKSEDSLSDERNWRAPSPVTFAIRFVLSCHLTESIPQQLLAGSGRHVASPLTTSYYPALCYKSALGMRLVKSGLRIQRGCVKAPAVLQQRRLASTSSHDEHHHANEDPNVYTKESE